MVTPTSRKGELAMVERVSGGKDDREEGPRARAKPRKAAKPAKAAFDKRTIALVYDFDGTLSPRPMQDYAFLPQIGEDAAAFWKESNELARARRRRPR